MWLRPASVALILLCFRSVHGSETATIAEEPEDADRDFEDHWDEFEAYPEDDEPRSKPPGRSLRGPRVSDKKEADGEENLGP